MTIRELTGQDIQLSYAAMFELRGQRPPLASPEAFQRWVTQQAAQGYRLAATFEAKAAEAQAVCGFRVLNFLYSGRQLYIDDLSTLPQARARGHARALLDWAEAEAGRLDCESLHLDSGVQRFGAHRLYLKAGMDITAHHFAKSLR
ncbi:GNAT family N-acetyltransferase [Deinococcus psychrotolerans]|uniref:GNAT family N-acetyltransferase n=1 Tax=Deinococcus psychrotolerans TaxID=2489213 RepID=A0A3G8YAF2_9DEIO|nr:GNAT family N-acetyltransferase [Deinococcus psychrotolerans]AZI42349.1 GNAT family N-acetyltransferase [Deinococcus psychrotolerans]